MNAVEKNRNVRRKKNNDDNNNNIGIITSKCRWIICQRGFIHMKMGTTKTSSLNDYLLAYLWTSSLNYKRIINIISSFDEHAHKRVWSQRVQRVTIDGFKYLNTYVLYAVYILFLSFFRIRSFYPSRIQYTLERFKKEVHLFFTLFIWSVTQCSGWKLKRKRDKRARKRAEKKRQYFTPFKLIFRSASLSVC